MGLTLPSELTEPLAWIGLEWPQADEEKLFAAGQAWLAYAGKLQPAAQTSTATATMVWSENEGDSIDAFRNWWNSEDGPNASLNEGAVAAMLIGGACVMMAALTLAMKIAFIVQLIILLVQVVSAVSAAVATFGATLAAVPGFIAATRAFCRILIKQVVQQIQTVLKEILDQAKRLLRIARHKAGRATGRVSPGAGRLEQDLINRQARRVDPMSQDGHVNETYLVEFPDGSRAVYKPISGEDASLRNSIPSGTLGHREVAASRVNEDLGFDLVPTTGRWDGPDGPGSLQRFSDGSTAGLPPGGYSRVDQERMAVLDYVTGNTDRHPGNYLTGPDGRLVAIDHGYSFPENTTDKIRSDFVAQQLDQPLSPEVMDQVRRADPAQIADRLRDAGLGDDAVNGALNRLNEVQTRGTITGENWGGPIVDAHWRPVRG